MMRTLKCFKIIIRCSSSLSYKHQLSDEPLMSLTIGKLLANAAKKYPDRKATVTAFDNKFITFSQLLQSADRLGAAFRKLGLKKGDRLGIWSPNSIEWETVFFACHRTGIITVQLNPSYLSNEMVYCINKAGIKCIVCPERTEKHNFYEVLKEIDTRIFEGMVSNKVPSLEKVIIIGNTSPRGTLNLEEIQEGVTHDDIVSIEKYQDEIDMDSGAKIIFTSGTTGSPKAALLSHHGLINCSYFYPKRLKYFEKQHVILSQVPFFHTFGSTGVILGSVHYGATVVIPSTYYNPVENFHALESERCSIVYGTPTMFVDLIKQQAEKKRPIQVEIAGCGGATTTHKLVEDIYKVLGVKYMVNFYGMTESTGTSFVSSLNDSHEETGDTVGHVLDHAEVKVIDADGNMVPYGTPGELCVRGYLTMLGYYGDEKSTQEVISPDRWLKSGDKFILYENGYGKVVGRIKDIIIRGGENIYPKEIEDCISQHPKVIECHVVGVPHERYGEEVCACVRLANSASEFTLEEVQDFCKNQMATYKIPTKLRVLNEFPKTSSGKVQKFKIIDNIVKEIQTK